MNGYPWIYWVVVLIVAGAVSAVLIGIGYLLGLKVAARRVETVREEMARVRDERWTAAGGLATRYQNLAESAAALPGPKKARIR